MEAQLAAAGFVVAAPDFPFTSANSEWLDRGDVVNQAADVSALITQLTEPTTVPAALRGVIAAGPVGVIGHSDGGITAAAVAYNASVADARVGAAVILSGAEIMYGGPWFTTASPPLLAIHGDADEVNPYWASEQLFADATGPRWLVTVARRRAPRPVHHWVGRAGGRRADRRLPPRAAPARPGGRGTHRRRRERRRSLAAPPNAAADAEARGSAERGHDLRGEESQVVEVAEIDHLQVDGVDAGVAVLTDAVDDLRRCAAEAEA